MHTSAKQTHTLTETVGEIDYFHLTNHSLKEETYTYLKFFFFPNGLVVVVLFFFFLFPFFFFNSRKIISDQGWVYEAAGKGNRMKDVFENGEGEILLGAPLNYHR